MTTNFIELIQEDIQTVANALTKKYAETRFDSQYGPLDLPKLLAYTFDSNHYLEKDFEKRLQFTLEDIIKKNDLAEVKIENNTYVSHLVKLIMDYHKTNKVVVPLTERQRTAIFKGMHIVEKISSFNPDKKKALQIINKYFTDYADMIAQFRDFYLDLEAAIEDGSWRNILWYKHPFWLVRLAAVYDTSDFQTKNEIARQEKKIIENETEFVLGDRKTDSFFVVQPKTHESAIFWGVPAWCTSNKKDKDAFNDYSGHGGLYILIFKTGVREEKYQFFVRDSDFGDNDYERDYEFNDAANNTVDVGKFDQSHPGFDQFINLPSIKEPLKTIFAEYADHAYRQRHQRTIVNYSDIIPKNIQYLMDMTKFDIDEYLGND